MFAGLLLAAHFLIVCGLQLAEGVGQLSRSKGEGNTFFFRSIGGTPCAVV